MSNNPGICSEQPKEKQIDPHQRTHEQSVTLGHYIIESCAVKNQIRKKEGKNQHGKINQDNNPPWQIA